MQATNFGSTFDQLFLRIFLYNFHRRCLSTSSIPWCKKVKNDQKLKSRGGGSCLKYILASRPFPGDPLRIGYRLRWRSDIWRTDRGVAEVRSPGIRPATDDDIRHNAPGLLETVGQLLRTKVRRKLLNQDNPSCLASYALQQHKAKSARWAASEFSFLLAVLRRSW